MDTSLVKDFGLPVALVLFATLFFWKGLWPWMKEQVKIAQDQRDKEREQSTIAWNAVQGLKETLEQHAEIGLQTITLLKELNSSVRRPR